MSNTPQIAHLRDRAQHLRTMATMIASTPAISIYRYAGPDTWVGPTAQACLDALVALSSQLEAHRQSLCDKASGLDREADDLQLRLPILTMVS